MDESRQSVKVTAPSVASRKRRRGGEPLVMVTAYDTPFARIVDRAGVDLILVGDSVANNVLGFDDTLHVGIDEMVHHVGAVARATPRALIVADLPWMSYHVDTGDTLRNAARLIRAGAGAVKLEGGRRRLGAISAILDAEIPVMGHLGLTPQSLHAMGGLKVQGRDVESASELALDAKALEGAGCFALVLEGVPDVVGELVTEAVEIPVIGIGAGAAPDGQVLVLHDLLGLGERAPARFARQYVDLAALATDAISQFAEDVRSSSFPAAGESYHGPDALRRSLEGTG
jgi:3-methyl-2-oxobutanoate hydroxymethyltransferase